MTLTHVKENLGLAALWLMSNLSESHIQQARFVRSKYPWEQSFVGRRPVNTIKARIGLVASLAFELGNYPSPNIFSYKNIETTKLK